MLSVRLRSTPTDRGAASRATLQNLALQAAAAIVILTCVFGTPTAGAGSSNVRLLVKFTPAATQQARASLLSSVHAKQIGVVHDLGIKVLSVPASVASAAVATMRGSSLVAYAEDDQVRRPTDTTPNDPLFPIGATWGGEWGSLLTQAPKAWDLTTGSSQVVLADIDSGVAGAHPDLAAQLAPGYNTLDGSSNTNDTYGHGTWAAGVMAASSNNGAGIAGYCWTCRLMPVKVYSSSSGAYDSDIAAGITWAVDHGARVLNISLAGPGTSATLSNAVAYARQHGAVVVAAAGNSGCNCLQYPAAYPGVISVGASTQSDTLYSYSNYGSWVDLAAPGQNVTTMLADPVTGAPYGYGPVGGTSMAAPVVAGIAGLLFSAYPSATASDVTNALFAGIDPAYGNPVRYGRVDAYKALLSLGVAPPGATVPANSTPPTISGTALVGQTLSVSTGTWSGSPTSYGYQWARCDTSGAGCVALSGATSSNYALTSADAGLTMRVTVTASNSAGSSSTTSAPTGVVANAPSSAPTNQTLSFSGSLNQKTASKGFSVTVGSGLADARLSFSKCNSLSLALSNAASASGPSVVVLDQTLAAGTYTYTVSGGKCSFALTVTSPTP